MLPLSKAGLITGFTLSFAHTLGEFGVVLMVGGNIPGVTRTISIDIYDRVQAGKLRQRERDGARVARDFFRPAVDRVRTKPAGLDGGPVEVGPPPALAVPHQTLFRTRSAHSQALPESEGSFHLNVHFRALAGFTILFGASGAGKTTLLDCIAG